MNINSDQRFCQILPLQAAFSFLFCFKCHFNDLHATEIRECDGFFLLIVTSEPNEWTHVCNLFISRSIWILTNLRLQMKSRGANWSRWSVARVKCGITTFSSAAISIWNAAFSTTFVAGVFGTHSEKKKNERVRALVDYTCKQFEIQMHHIFVFLSLLVICYRDTIYC